MADLQTLFASLSTSSSFWLALTLGFYAIGQLIFKAAKFNLLLSPIITAVVCLIAVLDAAVHVQRFRPRYCKLLYFRQQGDKVWWDGVVTEENDMFGNVSLPAQCMYVRGKRRMFDERTCPGMAVQVRIGRVHPLYNDIQILDAVSMDV